MSEAKSEPTCAHCGEVVDLSDTYEDAWCSESCAYHDKGAGLLRDLKDDHTICASCMKRIAERGVVADSHPDNFTGYQYPTEHAEYDGGLTCGYCGTMSASDDFLRKEGMLEKSEIAKAITALVHERTERGQYDKRVDEQGFIEDYESGRDLAEALGRNIQ